MYSVRLNAYWILTLKGPGFFVYLKSGGGGSAPPSDLGRGATKKVAKNFKKKVMKACGAGKKFREIIARNVEGGRIPDSPPPALLGLMEM